MRLFVDTNFFLQCKVIPEIDWDQVTDDDTVELIVARPVQEEIDRLKNDGNGRRAKRARRTNGLFREMIVSADGNRSWSVGKKIITLVFAEPFAKLEREQCQSRLDLSRPDDEIIASLIFYKISASDENVSLLTHDTNPMLTCKQNGVSFVPIPDEWLLPPEMDDRDKQIAKLQSDLRNAVNRDPQVEVDFNIDGVDLAKGASDIRVRMLERLSPEQVTELVSEMESRHPMKINFSQVDDFSDGLRIGSLGSFKKYEPPSEADISRYQKEEYPEWIENIRSFFETYTEHYNHISVLCPFTLTLKNVGRAPVENMILKFELLEGGTFGSPDIKNSQVTKPRLDVPLPPEPPKGKWTDTMSAISALARAGYPFERNLSKMSFPAINKPIQRDRFAFHWRDSRPIGDEKRWTLECDEFRHGSNKVFEYCINFDDSKPLQTVVFRVTASGSNLADAFSRIFTMSVSITTEPAYKNIVDALLL
jgi:hypothetical protein